VLADAGAEHAALFPDRVALCAAKAPDDLRNLVAARVAEHEKRESARLEQERERIRKEEAERMERERVAAEAQRAQQNSAAGVLTAQQPLDDSANNAGVATGSRNESPSESVTRGSLPPTISATPSIARVKLGNINARLAPLSISADGLAQLGFAAIGTSGAAKLYAESDWPRICDAIIALVSRAATTRRAA